MTNFPDFQDAKILSPELITNSAAEKLICPVLSSVNASGEILRVNCVHDNCALWYVFIKNGSDIKGNGLGQCDLRIICDEILENNVISKITPDLKPVG